MIQGKPYPKHKDSGIEWLGEVPDHWCIDRLRWTVRGCINGIWGNEADGVDDLICVRVADFDRNKFRVTINNPTYRAVSASERQGRLLKRGNLLLEKSGGGELQPVGAVMLFEFDTEAVCSNFIARMPVSPGFDPSYLTYFHAHLYSGRVNTRSIKQTTGIQNLDSMSYLDERISWPPLEEQRAIASFLDRETGRIDELVGRKERLIELLREKRQALISHAVTRGLNPAAPLKDSGIPWLGKIPEHWEVKKIKHLTTILRGKFSHRPRNDPRMYDGPYPFIQTGDVANAKKFITDYSQTLNEEGFNVSKQFPSGTLVMTIAANIGDMAILGFDACFPDSIVGFIPNKNISLDYFYNLMSSMKQIFFSTSPITTQMNLNVERIGALWTTIPPYDEQITILEFIEKASNKTDALISKLVESIERLKEYRTALISAAVTGKIDVRGDPS